MDKWYELWNIESGNLVASYDSLPIAMQNLERTAAIRPPSWFEGKELIAEHVDESDPEIVAEGLALYYLARTTRTPRPHSRTFHVKPVHVIVAGSKTAPVYTGNPTSIQVTGNWLGRHREVASWAHGIQGDAMVRHSETYEYQG